MPVYEETPGGTRSSPKFDIKDPIASTSPPFLTGIDGGNKSPKVADQLCVDISKVSAVYRINFANLVMVPVLAAFRSFTYTNSS